MKSVLQQSDSVLGRLKGLAPNDVYFLAPKAYVLRGYEYYAQGRLEAYSWNRTGTVLSAVVRGTDRYTVGVSVEEDELVYACTCPAWTSQSQCKHVICTLLTTIKILVPDILHGPQPDRTRLGLLERQLIEGSARMVERNALATNPPKFEVVLVSGDGTGKVIITNHGMPCQTVLGMPTELAVLLRSIQDPAWSTQEGLLSFLTHHGHRYPLVFDSDQGGVPVKWVPTATYTPKTELDIVGQEVRIAARCVRYGEVLDATETIMGLVVDLHSRQIAPLEYEGGWQVYDLLYEQSRRAGLVESRELVNSPLSLSRDTMSSERGYPAKNCPQTRRDPFMISVHDFLRLQCDIPLQEKTRMFWGIRLLVNGKEVPVPEPVPHDQTEGYQYRLTLLSERNASGVPLLDQESTILRAECWLGDSQASPSMSLFQVFPYLNHAPTVSAGMRTRKRRTRLYETLLAIWTMRNGLDVKRMMKSCLGSEEFHAFKLKAEADTLLQRFAEPVVTPSVRLAIAQGQWCLIPNDWGRESQLYAIPYRLFGAQIFEDMQRHDEMRLSTKVVFPALPELFSLLKEAGIALYFQESPIVTSQWEYSVEARRPASIDWFELHPEIMCDGVRVDAQDLNKILLQGGLMESNGAFRIIDKETQTILRTLASLTGSSRTKPDVGSKKAVVEVPKLQILDWVALRKQGVMVHLPPADEALIDRLLNFDHIPPRPVPQHLHTTLRRYQEEGYQWLAFLYQHRLGACLADDMGLGKTLQAISLLAGIKEGKLTPPETVTGPHLVVLPPSLLFNWEYEIQRFYPDLQVCTYTGKERNTAFDAADVVLTTYGLVRRDIQALEQVRFHVIVFDEAQAVKNIVARTTGAARRLKGYFKCVMTGTPLENHIGEYYSLMDLCVPGLLGEYEEMRSHMKAPTPLVLETIMQRTRPFVLRRTKQQILKELPPKTETDLYLELTERQKTLYQQTVAAIRATIATAYQTKTAAQARVIALTAILKLRQICLSPRLLTATGSEQSPKVSCLLDRLRELIEEGHSALVFSQFTSFLDIVEMEFHAHDIPYVRLDGSTPTPMRKKLVHQFQEGVTPSVFLLSLKAGGQGLNLTKASYVFHLDPWWNPAVENQASDRAHRIGQHRKVSIMRLLMRHTIEEKMMELKRKKLELYHAVLEGAADHRSGTALTQKDFEFLLE